MTILDALHWAIDSLKGAGIETAVTDAEWLLGETVSSLRHQLYLQNRQLTDEEIARYTSSINRRCSHEPVAYIIGYKTFLDWNFVVSPDVLIPRWETELLVNEVVKHSHPDWRLGIELGTGSGAIAISLAKMLPHIQIYATDISGAALQIAWLNAGRLGVIGRNSYLPGVLPPIHLPQGEGDRVTLLQGDMFSILSGLGLQKRVDFIVSNPPYVTTKEMNSLPPDVRDFEPESALDGGEDGLDYYREIIDHSPDYLVSGGYLALEVGLGQAETVNELMQGCFKTQIINDLCGKQRVILGYYS